MTDIVERLRVRRYSRTGDTELITLEAAAEIERLRGALEWIAETTLTQPGLMVEKARAALQKEKGGQ